MGRAVEGLEDALALGRLDAGAAVGHGDGEPLAVPAHREVDRRIGRRVLGGVLDQVDHGAEGVDEVEPPELYRLRELDRGAQLVPADDPPDLLDGGADQVLAGVDLGREAQAAGVQARQVEEVGDHAVETVGLPLDHRGALVATARDVVRQGLDRGQRRAQVVRHRGEQGVLHAVGLAQGRGVLGRGDEARALLGEAVDLLGVAARGRGLGVGAAEKLGRHRRGDEEGEELQPVERLRHAQGAVGLLDEVVDQQEAG